MNILARKFKCVDVRIIIVTDYLRVESYVENNDRVRIRVGLLIH